jgi:cytidine deaminase
MGFCAVASAIAAMITSGENTIEKIMATWKDENGDIYILPPCGRCREFIKKIAKDNIHSEVILGNDKTVELSELLPHDNEFVEI